LSLFRIRVAWWLLATSKSNYDCVSFFFTLTQRVYKTQCAMIYDSWTRKSANIKLEINHSINFVKQNKNN